MSAAHISRTDRTAWQALEGHCQKTRKTHLREFFAADPKRGLRMTLDAAGLFLEN